MKVTMGGNPVTLEGTLPAVGSRIPAFTVTAADLSGVSQSEMKGKTVFLTVPSVDTPVCDTEVRRFNQEAAALDGVTVNVISMDLPFAQARWCGAAGIDAVKLYSDYNGQSFGKAFGVLIKELGLLARAAFVADADGIIRYVQVVPEVTNEPNYDEILAAVKNGAHRRHFFMLPPAAAKSIHRSHAAGCSASLPVRATPRGAPHRLMPSLSANH